MPITQQRMIALISEAKDCQRAYEELLNVVESWANAQLQLRVLTEAQWRELQLQLRFVQRPRTQQIAIEAYHFGKFARENAKAKSRQSNRRAAVAQGLPVIRRPTGNVKHIQRESVTIDPSLLLDSMNAHDPLQALETVEDFLPETEITKEYFLKMGLSEQEAENQLAAFRREGIVE